MKLPFLKKKQVAAPDKIFDTEATTSKDIIAPSSVKVDSEYIDLNGRFAKSFFIFSYPRYLTAAWLASTINLDLPMDIAMFVHPIDTCLLYTSPSPRD